jgi:predicted naringenin-chalcone synthase
VITAQAPSQFKRLAGRSPLCLAGFQTFSPRFRTPQKSLQDWLAAAHHRSGTISIEEIQARLTRYGPSLDQIAYRGHELEDFTHTNWEHMRLFGGTATDIGKKTKFFDESIDRAFENLYPEPSEAPGHLIHVTCTGYSAPSGAQRLVSRRHWGERTQVLHAYHMGCYAAHPALKIAAAQKTADIVHTELCSLHLDPAENDPAQLVIQSLFADGFIKYQMGPLVAQTEATVLEVLSLRDIIVSDSSHAMSWGMGPFVFEMGLSKEVPVLFAGALPRLMESLFSDAKLDYSSEKETAVFAIHPGGPRIIELSERILGLKAEQTLWSRAVLRDHGNMSSATLPHIWDRILRDPSVPDGTFVVSVGAGPGLTLSGALFRKRVLP